MKNYNFKFELGSSVKDKISEFTGLVISRTQYLTGCNRYGIQSRNFDEDQLEELKEKKVKIKTDKTKGGYKPDTSRNSMKQNYK